ncbi:hypothetical protein D049_3172, partial [Vibrio parahaemolyticus VPTS-2010]
EVREAQHQIQLAFAAQAQRSCM